MPLAWRTLFGFSSYQTPQCFNSDLVMLPPWKLSILQVGSHHHHHCYPCSPSFPPPTPYKINRGGGVGGYWNHLVGSVVLSKCPIMSTQYLLNRWTIFYQTWYGGVLSRGDMSCKKNWFTIFSVKVTVRAYIIKIWLFLLYLLNCWSVCNQTWFDRTAS